MWFKPHWSILLLFFFFSKNCCACLARRQQCQWLCLHAHQYSKVYLEFGNILISHVNATIRFSRIKILISLILMPVQINDCMTYSVYCVSHFWRLEMFESLLLNYCKKVLILRKSINIIFRIWLQPKYRCACKHSQFMSIEILIEVKYKTWYLRKSR